MLPCFLDTPTNSSTEPEALLLKMLVEAFPRPPPSSTCPSLISLLTELHPNNNMMWCCYLGYFSRVSRDLNDRKFTEIVDSVFERFEEKERMRRSSQSQQSKQKTRVSPTTVPADPLAAARQSPKYENEMKETEALKLKVLEAQRAAEEAQRTAQEMIRQAMEAKEEVRGD